jgi:high affinity Mn2+ porin
VNEHPEIDRTVTFGALLKGSQWRRPQDQVGLAFAFNGISGPHRDYLAAGGLGFILGDDALNYSPEIIMETFYNWELRKFLTVTLDYQCGFNPGYNADRGPVSIGALRVHLAF